MNTINRPQIFESPITERQVLKFMNSYPYMKTMMLMAGIDENVPLLDGTFNYRFRREQLNPKLRTMLNEIDPDMMEIVKYFSHLFEHGSDSVEERTSSHRMTVDDYRNKVRNDYFVDSIHSNNEELKIKGISGEYSDEYAVVKTTGNYEFHNGFIFGFTVDDSINANIIADYLNQYFSQYVYLKTGMLLLCKSKPGYIKMSILKIKQILDDAELDYEKYNETPDIEKLLSYMKEQINDLM